MLKYYIRHGVVVDKNQEITSIEESNWLEKFIAINTQKRNMANN